MRTQFQAKLLVGLLFVCLLGCGARTKVISSWKEPTFKGATLPKVLVLAVTENVSARQMLEQEFIRQLNARGFQAVDSSAVVNEPEKPLAQVIESTGVDAVYSIRLLEIEKKTKDQLEIPTYPSGRNPGLDEIVVTYSTSTSVTPALNQTTIARVRHAFWRVAEKKRLWTADTETYDATTLSAKTAAVFAETALNRFCTEMQICTP